MEYTARQKSRAEAAALAAKLVTVMAVSSVTLAATAAGSEIAALALVCVLAATVLALAAFLDFPRPGEGSTKRGAASAAAHRRY